MFICEPLWVYSVVSGIIVKRRCDMSKTSSDAKGVVYMLQWDEFERGWGRRPDGFSFHSSPESCAAYLKDFYARRGDGPAPDEYDSPSSSSPVKMSASLGFVKWVEQSDRRLGERVVETSGGQVVVASERLLADLAPFEALGEREALAASTPEAVSASKQPRI